MTDLVLIGGGGHCKACIDVIERCPEFRIAGILDVKERVGQTILGYEIIGTDDAIDALAPTCQFLLTVGHIESAALRKRQYERLKAQNASLATVVSPKALVSRHSTVGEGTIVMHGATIGPASAVGVNCIVNTGANVEHDCTIGAHVHLSTHAILNGGCSVGDESFVGSNAVLVHGTSLGIGLVIGAGTVVARPLPDPGIYVGNPARRIRLLP